MDAKTLTLAFISSYSFLYFIFLVSYIYILVKGKQYGLIITIYSYILFILSLGGLTINYYLFENDTNWFNEDVNNKKIIQRVKLFVIIIFVNILSVYVGYKMKALTSSKVSNDRVRLLLLLVCFLIYIILIIIYLIPIYFIDREVDKIKEVIEEKPKTSETREEKNIIRRQEITDEYYK